MTTVLWWFVITYFKLLIFIGTITAADFNPTVIHSSDLSNLKNLLILLHILRWRKARRRGAFF